MGYRAVAITEDIGLVVPQWFVNKWAGQLNIASYPDTAMEDYRGKPTAPISYKWERKWHDDVVEDLQKVVGEQGGQKHLKDHLQMIMMHEDGNVNRLTIYADRVVIEAPDDWVVMDDLWQL